MHSQTSAPPTNPDIKREVKKQLLGMSARGFEFFAGDLLVYIGLESVSVTRYVGDGGIDAQGDLIAGMFRIPTGIQVKRYRNNVQRPDIEKFIGALSGRFSQGMFMTTANYAPSALQKASSSIPRVLTLNGDQIVSVMVEHCVGLKVSPTNMHQFDIDPDYFTALEARKGLLRRVSEASPGYSADSSTPDSDTMADDQTLDLKPEEDLISLNALGYSLRVDPVRVRRWVENETLRPDVSQRSGDRTIYYFRRDRTEQIRKSLNLERVPSSSDEWKQEFLDFAKSRSLSRSYKPVMVKAFFKLADREGKVIVNDLVREFREYYIQRLNTSQPLEHDASLMAHPIKASDNAVKRLIITNPLERFLIKNFMEYFPEEGILQITPQLWQELRYYEVVDLLKSADEQIHYYVSRHEQRDGSQ
ncbi:MAG: restriction endonuclease [Ktedonobacteraceae bacterium]|nr:restriction endonuclease [Ktedonobacteraceae bacterium]